MASRLSSCFFLLVCICISSCTNHPVSSASTYHDHCSLTVPESIPTTETTGESEVPPSFFTYDVTGGESLLDRKLRNGTYVREYIGKTLRLEVSPEYYATESEGILNVKAFLFINYMSVHGEMEFYMNGFWSKTAKKLCMVGSASWKSLKLDGVLKLNYPSDNPDMFTGITSGTFESTATYNDPAYFDPISIFRIEALPNYNYSLVARELAAVSPDSVEAVGNGHRSLIPRPEEFCPVLSGRSTILELKFSEDCNRETQHCFPITISNQDAGLPRYVYLNPFQCSADKRTLRYLIRFQEEIDPTGEYIREENLIGEASWEEDGNSLLIVACRILNPADHPSSVGDCTMRFRLRYISNLTIKNIDTMVGYLWSTKDVRDSGYFTPIELADTHQDYGMTLPGMRYEYSMLDVARNICPVVEMSAPAEKGRTYPDVYSSKLGFGTALKTDEEEVPVGYLAATPVSVGNEFYKIRHTFLAVDSAEPGASGIIEIPLQGIEIDTSSANISYKITIEFFSFKENVQHQSEIIAEGVYNPETGHLCMVGCRKLSSNGHTDCEIQVNVQFPPNELSREIDGTIRSTRQDTDPLYFKEMAFIPREYGEGFIRGQQVI